MNTRTLLMLAALFSSMITSNLALADGENSAALEKTPFKLSKAFSEKNYAIAQGAAAAGETGVIAGIYRYFSAAPKNLKYELAQARLDNLRKELSANPSFRQAVNEAKKEAKGAVGIYKMAPTGFTGLIEDAKAVMKDQHYAQAGMLKDGDSWTARLIPAESAVKLAKDNPVFAPKTLLKTCGKAAIGVLGALTAEDLAARLIYLAQKKDPGAVPGLSMAVDVLESSPGPEATETVSCDIPEPRETHDASVTTGSSPARKTAAINNEQAHESEDAGSKSERKTKRRRARSAN